MSLPISHNRVFATVPQTPTRTPLPPEAMEKLRDGLSSCRTNRTVTPEARLAIEALVAEARRSGWTPEQLLIAVKDACYTAPEIAELTTTSEREVVLSRIVTVCIKEYFRPLQ